MVNLLQAWPERQPAGPAYNAGWPRRTTWHDDCHHGNRDAHLAAAICGLPVIGVALSFTALCAWAARRGMAHARVPGRRGGGSRTPFRRRAGRERGGDRCGVLE